MQMSPSLADFMANLEKVPRGLQDALAIVDKCAADRSDTLDLQQMHLTDDDVAEIAKRFPDVADHVTTLNLFMNEMTTLPDSLNALRKLHTLLAGCNPLQSVSPTALNPLPSLTTVDLGFSQSLPALPPSFFSTLTSLETLHLGNNRLTSLPPTLFTTCTNLRSLHAYGNDLTSLPPAIGNLRNLEVLNVGRNQITHLPDEIGQCSQLHTLHIYENCLRGLPQSIASMPNLTTLTAHANEHLPVPPRSVRCADGGTSAVAQFYAEQSVAKQ